MPKVTLPQVDQTPQDNRGLLVVRRKLTVSKSERRAYGWGGQHSIEVAVRQRWSDDRVDRALDDFYQEREVARGGSHDR